MLFSTETIIVLRGPFIFLHHRYLCNKVGGKLRDQWPQSNFKVKNEWNFTPLHFYMAHWAIQLRVNFHDKGLRYAVYYYVFIVCGVPA